MPDPAATRRAVLTEAAERLAAAGLAEPRREALRLWAVADAGGAADAIIRPDAPATAEELLRFGGRVHRRAAGEPFAHVSGWAGFRRLVLRSDRRALIPRPETEGLVDLLLGRVRTGRVADVGTGSGCLALSLATEGGFDQVMGIDLEAEPLALARENRELTGAPVALMQGDLCAPLRDGCLDALVSNPPYLTTAEYSGLDPAVRDWEPAVALESGADGMAATARLLDQARRVVRPGGWIAVEVDCTRAGACAAQAAGLGWSDVVVEADLFGRERYLLARRSASS